jgi:hypothetical protein
MTCEWVNQTENEQATEITEILEEILWNRRSRIIAIDHHGSISVATHSSVISVTSVAEFSL